jgi:hypothetical protein
MSSSIPYGSENQQLRCQPNPPFAVFLELSK